MAWSDIYYRISGGRKKGISSKWMVIAVSTCSVQQVTQSHCRGKSRCNDLIPLISHCASPPCHHLPPLPLNPATAVGIYTSPRWNKRPGWSHSGTWRMWAYLSGKQYFHMIYTATTVAMETKIRDGMIPGWSPNPGWRETIRITSGCLKSP